MANISTAEGSITLKGSSKSICAFLEVMAFTKTYTYGVDIPDYEDSITQQTKFGYAETEETLDFLGFGRWNMEETLKNLFTWLDYDRTNEPKWTSELEKAWQQLNQDPLTATFDYIDQDGNEFIVEETAEVTWAKNQLPDNVVKLTEKEEYKPTAQNFDKYAGQDVYDYSAYTVNKLINANSPMNWIEALQKTDYRDKIDFAKFKIVFDKVTTRLGKELDLKQPHANIIVSEPQEWFENETVEDTLIAILKQH